MIFEEILVDKKRIGDAQDLSILEPVELGVPIAANRC